LAATISVPAVTAVAMVPSVTMTEAPMMAPAAAEI
jgi:hypothetical protein